MASVAPSDVAKLALVAAAGLWIDEHPIPDIFTLLPYQLADALFHDPKKGAALLTGGVDFNDLEALKTFYIMNARRLAMAGKILFPVPNRRVSKRLYRLAAETLVLWGEGDKLIPPVYAARWAELIPHAKVVRIAEAGHMVPYEQPEARRSVHHLPADLSRGFPAPRIVPEPTARDQARHSRPVGNVNSSTDSACISAETAFS